MLHDSTRPRRSGAWAAQCLVSLLVLAGCPRERLGRSNTALPEPLKDDGSPAVAAKEARGGAYRHLDDQAEMAAHQRELSLFDESQQADALGDEEVHGAGEKQRGRLAYEPLHAVAGHVLEAGPPEGQGLDHEIGQGPEEHLRRAPLDDEQDQEGNAHVDEDARTRDARPRVAGKERPSDGKDDHDRASDPPESSGKSGPLSSSVRARSTSSEKRAREPAGTAEQVSPPRWLHFAAEHDLVRLRTIRATREDVLAVRERLGRRIRLRKVTFYEAVKDGQIAAVACRSVEGGLHGPIHFAIYLDREGKVARVQVIELHEVRGAPVVEERFLSQYIGKSADDPTSVGVDVDAITGATVSSKAVTRGVKKAVILWEHFYR